MRTTVAKRACALAFAVVVPFSVASPAYAAPSGVSQQSNKSVTNAEEFDSATEKQQVEQLAKVLEKVDNAPNREEAERIMVENFGEEGLEEAAKEIGVDPNNPLGEGSPTRSARGEVNEEGFVECMAGKVGDEIKKLLNINGIALALGQKDYPKMAAEIVKYLAKQGIKRNVGALALLLAWYGAQCVFA